MPRNGRFASHSYYRIVRQVFARDGHRCRICGASSADGVTKLHADHIQPRSAGGQDVLDNLRTLCAACNLRRGAGTLSDEEVRSGPERPRSAYRDRPGVVGATATISAPAPAASGRYTFPVHRHGELIVGDTQAGDWPMDGTCPPSCNYRRARTS